MSSYPIKTDFERRQEEHNRQVRFIGYANYVQQNAIKRQMHEDMTNNTEMILGTSRALNHSLNQGFQGVMYQMGDVSESLSSFGNDINRMGYSIDKMGSSISRVGYSVDQVNDSINHLENSFLHQFRQVEENNNERFLQIKAKISESVSILSDIALQMYGQAELLQDINQTQKELFSDLNASILSLHETVKNDYKKWANEKLNTGMEYLGKKLLPEAAEAFTDSIGFYKVEPLAHYFLGKIYAFGIDDTTVLVDYPSAIEHLKLAMRYSKDQVESNRDMALLYADAAANLARAYYLYAKLDEVNE